MNDNLNGLLAAFQRPAWRPGTTALAVMGLASFLFGIYLWGCGTIEVPWWKSSLWLTWGIFLALWTNGMEIASPIQNAIRKKVAEQRKDS